MNGARMHECEETGRDAAAEKRHLGECLQRLAVMGMKQLGGVDALVGQHAIGRAEGQETRVPVVMPHSRGADAAQWQVVPGDTQQRVAQADATGRGSAEYAILLCLAVSEAVVRQRAVALSESGTLLVQTGFGICP
ncbi:hypothetical protein B1218_36185, partial [Pseudomonas ogarae]